MNIALRIEEQARLRPSKIAIKFPKKFVNDSYLYDEKTFKELNAQSMHYAHYLSELGIKKGSRVLLFVKPSIDFPCLVFALFKIGAIPVMIDPGMGKKNLLASIKQVRPEAMIAESQVHFLSIFYPSVFKSIKINVSVGIKFNSKTVRLKKIKSNLKKEFVTEECVPDDPAAILFTSGGTGIPKGVEYTHKIFNKQTDALKEMFDLSEKDIDLPGFPLFSFFTMAMGMTSCIPDMNPSKPASCNPQNLVQNINDNSATFIAGSPAIWERVVEYCLNYNLILPTVKHLVMFGAPVRVDLHKKLSKILTNGTTYTPYGATEALPVSNISGQTILSKTASETLIGKGTCIGLAAPGIEIKIIKTSDNVIENLEENIILANNEVGEIIVRGDVVTKSYYNMPEKTKEAKINDNGTIWHRMGDLGFLDELGQLWFLGRKVHRVELANETKYSIATEAIFNNHILVKKSALVALRKKNSPVKPCMVIQTRDPYFNKSKLKIELRNLAIKYNHTKDIEDFYFMEEFPVDVRHNIKIDRTKIEKMLNSGNLK